VTVAIPNDRSRSLKLDQLATGALGGDDVAIPNDRSRSLKRVTARIEEIDVVALRYLTTVRGH